MNNIKEKDVCLVNVNNRIRPFLLTEVNGNKIKGILVNTINKSCNKTDIIEFKTKEIVRKIGFIS